MSAPHTTAFTVGLTGGIGSGKSLVADMFAARGATVVDTDAIAHAMTAPHGPAMHRIEAEFGRAYIAADGSMDRARMRELVFTDAGAKRRLEAILHPMIREAANAAAVVAQGAYTIFAVPLLVEAGGWRERVARVLVVDCPEALQVQRVMARNGLSEQQVRAIMANQATREARQAAADDIVDNSGSIDDLGPQVERLHQQYLAFAAKLAAGPIERL
ncbi:dephospho-CoA kinase [Pseudoduganella sp. GCM10020061]|uniref:dephospho-CoA kinase n=1 Tax=Pseudoduganella sp. GCM10020061 TaxID=3317345 RepID=UPI0036453BE4